MYYKTVCHSVVSHLSVFKILCKDIDDLKDMTRSTIMTYDIYRTLNLRTTEYTLFSTVHGMFTKIEPILGHKTSR